MPKRKKPKEAERPVFDSIRKPTAPPSRKIGERKSTKQIDPVGRKSKHKSRNSEETAE